MFTLRFRSLISVAMVASLLTAQFAHVPHVHAASFDNDLEHNSRSHIHVGHDHTSKHAHSHSHKHSQSDPKKLPKSLAVSVEHDQDAIYLAESPVPISVRSALQVPHVMDVLSICLPFAEQRNRPDVEYDRWHLPDKYRHCPIFLLTMSIRC